MTDLTVDLPGARVLFTSRRDGSMLDLAARSVLAARLNVEPAAVRQVHGGHVHVLRGDGEGEVEADGVATAQAGRAPLVVTADCLPIAIAGAGAVAMVHAGWQGLDKGVITAGIDALARLGATLTDLEAAIGPGAGRCCYEVGDELRQRFAGYGNEVRQGRNLDLKLIARRQFLAAGVPVIHDVGLCTICSDPSRFFSYRRDGAQTGCQAGLAWLT